jgi:hypothetical protein
MSKKKDKPIKNKILVKENDGIYAVNASYFSSIKAKLPKEAARMIALDLAIKSYNEIQRALLVEATENKEVIVGGVRVVDGLLSCLDELENNFPCIVQEIHAVQRKNIVYA